MILICMLLSIASKNFPETYRARIHILLSLLFGLFLVDELKDNNTTCIKWMVFEILIYKGHDEDMMI